MINSFEASCHPLRTGVSFCYVSRNSGLNGSGNRSGEGGFPKNKSTAPCRTKKEKIMITLQSKTTRSQLTCFGRFTTSLLAVILFAAVSLGCAGHRGGGHSNRPTCIPAGLDVPAGNDVASHSTGVGVQIYVWTANPTNAALASWIFKAPHAVLFAPHKKARGELVGIHFAGPTWQGNDGSKVVVTRVASVTVDATAIPWLLLQATSTSGDGVFTDTTYVQRLNTVGGLVPSTPGNSIGDEALVPYVADYYFYRVKQ